MLEHLKTKKKTANNWSLEIACPSFKLNTSLITFLKRLRMICVSEIKVYYRHYYYCHYYYYYHYYYRRYYYYNYYYHYYLVTKICCKILITKFESPNFSHKILVTKFSHKLLVTILVTNFSHIILVTIC